MNSETQVNSGSTEEEFNQYFATTVANGFYSRVKRLVGEIKKEDFYSTLQKEIPNVKQRLEELENSNAPGVFISFIKNYLDYGTQSAFWYYYKEEESANVSLACAAPETFEETVYRYLVAREWLVGLKNDGMI